VDLKLKSNNNGGSGGGGGSNLSDISINQAAYGMANLSLPLYSGLRVRYGIRSAEFLEKAATLDAGSDKEAVILNTIEAFSNLYKANANVRLIRENLAQSRSRDSDFSNLEKNGLLARNDRLKAALQTSNIELDLVDAESNLHVATVNMNLLLGLPEHEAIIPDSNSLVKPEVLKGIDEYEQLAVQNRKDVQALQYRKKATAAGIQSAKSDYYPSLALTGGYIAADIPNLVTLTNAVTYGVGLSYNVSSLWKTNARVAQAKARLAEVQANAEWLDDQVKLEINKAYESYLSAEKKMEVSHIAIDQATENYKITKNKYDNSLVTVTDLLDANVSLLQAKIGLELSKADAIVAYNTLLQKAGVLTGSLNTK
jgi:outer membrane protein TolC